MPPSRREVTAFLVTGDADRNKTMCVPGGGFATVRIELPRDWNRLMERRGGMLLFLLFISAHGFNLQDLVVLSGVSGAGEERKGSVLSHSLTSFLLCRKICDRAFSV